jgi:predicted PurR-regulated permease PerM
MPFAKNRLLYVLIVSLLAIGLLVLLWHIRPVLSWIWNILKLILTPLLISMIVAYLLNPVVNLLHRRKMPRSVAVLLIYGTFLLAMVLLFVNLFPVFVRQMRDLLEHLPEWTARLQLWLNYVYQQRFMLPGALQMSIEQAIVTAEQWFTERTTHLIRNLPSTVEPLVMLITIPFVTFYLLKDHEVMERLVMTFVPLDKRREISRLLRDIDMALGNYIRGQLLVASLIALLAYIGYWLIGLPYSLLLALFVGLMDIIPYIGPYLGAVPALLVALTVSPKMVLWVLIVNVIVQFVEGNVLSPLIVGRTVDLHPLTIIFTVLVGGKVAGLMGSLLAVPFVVVAKVVLEHLVAYIIQRKRMVAAGHPDDPEAGEKP